MLSRLGSRGFSSGVNTSRCLTKISDFTQAELKQVLATAADVKSRPEAYRDAMDRKTLIMLFQKPSLRTRVSFEVGMNQVTVTATTYPDDPADGGQRNQLPA